MAFLEFKRHKENYEINLFASKDSKSHYQNILDRDKHKLAQILMDLYFEGFPVKEAIEILIERLKKKDWLGF